MSKEDLMGGETPATETTTTETPATGAIETKFPENFPEEFRSAPAIQSFINKETGDIDYGKALTSYVHAQKMVGADKVAVPSKNATPEDWKAFYSKVGAPESADKYEINVEGFNIEDPMSKGFLETAQGVGLLPHQANAIVDYFQKTSGEQSEQVDAADMAAYEDEVAKLKTEWGDNFDTEAAKATEAFKTIFSAEEQQQYKEAGFLSQPAFVKAMNRVATTTLDDTTLNAVTGTSDKVSTAQALGKEYRESYAVIASGDKTRPDYKHHQAKLHTLNERAARLGVNIHSV